MSKEFTPSSAMAIVAHPDDIEFGCAGTVAKWTRRGAHVTYVIVTSGNIGTHDPAFTSLSLAEHREKEQRAAAAICGVHEVEFLRHNDGEVMPTLELRKELVRVIRKHKPEVVFSMDPTAFLSSSDYINHPDHRAVAVATVDAIAPVASMPLMYPELGAPHAVHEVWIQWTDKPDTWVDISETIDLKMDALRQHKSQVSEETVQGLRRWALDAGKGLAPAEAYRVITLVSREKDEQPVVDTTAEQELSQREKASESASKA
ncbi:MAG: PIG-L family deacetylase [Chloroflexi bacterium]|nr:PIG-L family deacetylase [Chloroflexota bacterium]